MDRQARWPRRRTATGPRPCCVVGAARRGRHCPADRVREHRQPAVGAHDGAAAGARGAIIARRIACSTVSARADRGSRARGRRRGCRPPARGMEHRRVESHSHDGGRVRVAGARRRAQPARTGVYGARNVRSGIRLRGAAGGPGHASEPVRRPDRDESCGARYATTAPHAGRLDRGPGGGGAGPARVGGAARQQFRPHAAGRSGLRDAQPGRGEREAVRGALCLTDCSRCVLRHRPDSRAIAAGRARGDGRRPRASGGWHLFGTRGRRRPRCA